MHSAVHKRLNIDSYLLARMLVPGLAAATRVALGGTSARASAHSSSSSATSIPPPPLVDYYYYYLSTEALKSRILALGAKQLAIGTAAACRHSVLEFLEVKVICKKQGLR